MERSPSWADKSSSVSQGLRRVCKDESPLQSSHMQPLTPMKSQMNPSHKIFFSLKLISILCSHLRLGYPSRLSRNFRRVYQNHPSITVLHHARYTPSLSLPPCFEELNEIWWGVQIIKLFLTQFSSVSCCFLPCRLIYNRSTRQSSAVTPGKAERRENESDRSRDWR